MGRIIAPHDRTYPDPLVVTVGDTLNLSGKIDHWNGKPEWTFLWCVNQHGKGGWVPQQIIEQHGATGIARQDYDCIELSVTSDEMVTMGDEISGWIWCTNQQGQRGWVPVECLQLLAY